MIRRFDRARRSSIHRRGCSIWAQVVAVVVILVCATQARALVVGGGGSWRTDCLAVLDGPINDPVTKPKNIVCVDGSSCDADGVVDGVCTFPIAVCANSTFDARCTLNGVQSMTVAHAADNGDPKFDTEFQAMQNRIMNDIDPPTTTSDECANFTNFRVAIVGPLNGQCKKGKKQLQLATVSKVINGHVYTDKDKVKMTCLPADPMDGGCDPTVLFDGTFDRIQRQIFNKSCAVSGCHDSQSHTGNMTLEQGSSASSLIDVVPENSAAQTADGGIWRRVRRIDATTGDPDHSLIVAKLIGPPKNFGDRMPKDRPKLDQSLIDVVELWVAAGAPTDTTWVPGTDQ
jgi:hypothetical protein